MTRLEKKSIVPVLMILAFSAGSVSAEDRSFVSQSLGNDSVIAPNGAYDEHYFSF